MFIFTLFGRDTNGASKLWMAVPDTACDDSDVTVAAAQYKTQVQHTSPRTSGSGLLTFTLLFLLNQTRQSPATSSSSSYYNHCTTTLCTTMAPSLIVYIIVVSLSICITMQAYGQPVDQQVFCCMYVVIINRVNQTVDDVRCHQKCTGNSGSLIKTNIYENNSNDENKSLFDRIVCSCKKQPAVKKAPESSLSIY